LTVRSRHRCLDVSELVYNFGPFQLQPKAALLLESGKPVRIGARALAILTVLVERAGEVIGQNEIIAAVWPDTTVDDSNLRVHLVVLRKLLGEGSGGGRYIVNVPGRGYRFVATVTGTGSPQAFERPLPNLPAQLTELVGREEFVRKVVDDLRRRRRLITVVGAGGIGKTSLALAVAHELGGGFRDGAYFVDFTSLTDPGHVPRAVAAALNLPLLSEQHLPALISFLRDKYLLLVLDNCEHVIDATALLVEALLTPA